jgi:hypothetical protein
MRTVTRDGDGDKFDDHDDTDIDQIEKDQLLGERNCAVEEVFKEVMGNVDLGFN